MGQNHAIATIELEDIVYTLEEITKSVDERAHIFEIKKVSEDESGEELGYVSLYDLKSYMAMHDDDVSKIQIKNIDSNEWITLVQHPFFQRRKPQLISAETLSQDDDQQFYILKFGQKEGPFEKFELTSMLEDKEILLTDMVSSNAGHTWMKLYQVDGFDRRILKDSDQLPGMPTEILDQHLESTTAGDPETEAISNLAFLSNVKRGKSTPIDQKIIQDYRPEMKSGSSSIYKWLFVLSIVGIGYFLYHISNQLDSPFKKERPIIGEQAEMLTPIDINGPLAPSTNPSARSQLGQRTEQNQVYDQRRSGGKFQERSFDPVRPSQRKSFMESGKFQEIQNSDAPGEEDPNYYYDNTSAMELDPVRSQVSKENFDSPQAESDGPIPASDNLFESEVSN